MTFISSNSSPMLELIIWEASLRSYLDGIEGRIGVCDILGEITLTIIIDPDFFSDFSMPTFAAFPDLHDRAETLKDIRHILADVDAVLLPGDMTNGKAEHLHQILNLIEPVNEQILAVCGNMDTEAMNMWLHREGISIHRHHYLLDDIAILGCGGALPFAGSYVFDEKTLTGFLQDTLSGIPEAMPKILICHQPPYGCTLDLLPSGDHVGSHAVREFIERVQPLICFTGHIHEATGTDTIGETRIINPGPLWQSGCYAFAEVEDGEVITLEIREAQKLEI